jgi:hypothetical protein
MALHTVATLRELLGSPGSFFEGRLPREGVAGGVVLAVAVAHTVVLLAGFGLLGVQLAALSADLSTGEAVGTFLAGAAVPSLRVGVFVFVNWLVVSAVLHVLVKLRHGAGTFGDTLYVVGWSAPVALLVPVAVVAGLALGLQNAGSAGAVARDVGVVRGTVGGLDLLATLVVLCVQGYVWSGGLQRTHDMDYDAALLPVIGTVVLGVLATLGTA